MPMKQIIKLFESGNVSVCGLRGRGKDMLFANVICRRKKHYVSNVDYGGLREPFVPLQYDCGKNTYKHFISGNVNYYDYPWPDGTDLYISDAGLYFPAQHCNELNRDFPYFSTFVALTRQLGECNMHFNVQNLNRCWDKIREQSDIYIMCNRCIVWHGWVLQLVTIYDQYDSAVKRVPPFRIKRPLFNPDRQLQWEMAYQSYLIAHGKIKSRILIYRNQSNYDTRVFKEMLKNGKKT